MNRLSDDRGGVLVLGAVMIPLFLLLTALIVDVGNWYVHKRQLQNRADAAALAAGVQYQANFPACITSKTQEDIIRAAARQYAGDPAATGPGQHRDCQPGESRRDHQLHELHRRHRRLRRRAPAPAVLRPSLEHQPRERVEHHAVRRLLDGREGQGEQHRHDLRRVRPEPPTDYGARARRAQGGRVRRPVHPHRRAGADDRQGTGAVHQPVRRLAGRSVLPAEAAEDSRPGGMQLWGPDLLGNQASVDPGQHPAHDAGGQRDPDPWQGDARLPECQPGLTRDYVPIGVEVRVAGRKDIDSTRRRCTCTALQTATSADCFKRISDIRVTSRKAGSSATVRRSATSRSAASGTSPCALDPFYARLALGATNCTFDATAYMDWGSRPLPSDGGQYEATIQVGSGTPRRLAGSPVGGVGPWVASGIPIATLGPLDVKVNWKFTLKSGQWEPLHNTGPARQAPTDCTVTESVRPDRVDDRASSEPRRRSDRRDATPPSDAVAAVKLTTGPALTSTRAALGGRRTPRSARMSRSASRTRISPATSPCSASAPGSRTSPSSAIRTGGSRAPRTRRRRSTSAASRRTRATTRPRRPSGGTASTGCPDWSTLVHHLRELPRTSSYPNSPWRCLHLQPGGKGQTIGDGIALRTKNCQTPAVGAVHLVRACKADCQASKYTCHYGVRWHPGDPPPAADDPRVVRLFVVPYGAYKDVANGNNADVPVLQLAAFYITGWNYNESEDPCDAVGKGDVKPAVVQERHGPWRRRARRLLHQARRFQPGRSTRPGTATQTT